MEALALRGRSMLVVEDEPLIALDIVDCFRSADGPAWWAPAAKGPVAYIEGVRLIIGRDVGAVRPLFERSAIEDGDGAAPGGDSARI